MKLEAKGFAIAFKGELLVSTVSPTERAAKVNALVTMAGVMIYQTTTDEQINSMFDQMVKQGVALIPVAITGEAP